MGHSFQTPYLELQSHCGWICTTCKIMNMKESNFSVYLKIFKQYLLSTHYILYVLGAGYTIVNKMPFLLSRSSETLGKFWDTFTEMAFYYFSDAIEHLALLERYYGFTTTGNKTKYFTIKGLNSPGKSLWLNPFAHLFCFF